MVSFPGPNVWGHEENAMTTEQAPRRPQDESIEQKLARDLAAWRLARDAIAKAARLTP